METGRLPEVRARDVPVFDWVVVDVIKVGVEFLFVGCADVMRRQVIPPLARFGAHHGRPLRVLDVGCGTGRTLLQLARALPKNSYRGVDLSPHYVAEAGSLLADFSNVEVVQAQAAVASANDAYVAGVSSYQLARAALARAVGVPESAFRQFLAGSRP